MALIEDDIADKLRETMTLASPEAIEDACVEVEAIIEVEVAELAMALAILLLIEAIELEMLLLTTELGASELVL